MKNKCTYILVGLMLFLTGCEDFLDKREDAGGLDETAMSLYVAFWIKYTANWTLITVW